MAIKQNVKVLKKKLLPAKYTRFAVNNLFFNSLKGD